MEEPLVSFDSVSKSYGAVQALNNVTLTAYSGRVVALVGDNGAGKSTLVKVMSGTIAPDTADVVFEGAATSVEKPTDASELGIATVYQDLALCNNLDVVANLFLGREISRGSVIDEFEMEARAASLLAQLSIRPPSLRAPVSTMSGGQRQSVAIARSLLGDPKMIILDEPTAALGVPQKKQVLDLIKQLRDRGLAVVLISHNLAEVFEVADRVEVLYLGQNAASLPGDTAYQDEVVAAITGSKFSNPTGQQ